MKCLNNCIFMYYIASEGFICTIAKKNPPWGKTCPYENKTVTELNMEANYSGEKKTSFVDCEYRRGEYCTNFKRNEKINSSSSALFYCLQTDCTYDTLRKWW